MEVLEIKILHHESGYIYYRISYKAAAVIAFLNTTKELPIDFTIETHASGTKAVDLKLEGSIDYPLLPISRAIKEKILKMDKEGLLPC